MGIGDPAWTARYGGSQSATRSRYTQPAPGASSGRSAAPRTYIAPHISGVPPSMVLAFSSLAQTSNAVAMAAVDLRWTP